MVFRFFNKKHYLCIEMDRKKQDIAYFLSFCIEQYKNANHLTGSDAMSRLDDFKVLDYLAEHYEILHTQSSQWILEDIDEFIKLRKEKEA